MPKESVSVSIESLYSDMIEACHNQVRLQFEPLIQATSALTEVQILAGLTLRLFRLARATRLLAAEGLREEAELPFRCATEAIVNLFYIMKVGPQLGDKGPTQLAEQFSAYGDVAYYKLLSNRLHQSRRAFKREYGWTDSQCDQFLAEKKRLRDDALNIHGCQKTRWHQLALADMAHKVRDNAPPYIDQKLAQHLFSSFVSANSAAHADALSLRSQYKALGNLPLELVATPETNHVDVAAMEVTWAWKLMAEYFGKSAWIDGVVETTLRNELRRRTDQAEQESKRPTILIP